MMLLFWFLVAALATWRLASLLARERGPFTLCVRVRECFGVHHAPDGTPATSEDGEVLLNPVTRWVKVDSVLHEVALGMTCVWCNSLWIAVFVAVLVGEAAPVLIYTWQNALLMVLGLSAGAIVINRVVEG